MQTKRRLDDDFAFNKKIRLDNIFKNLTISDKPKFEINPQIKTFNDEKEDLNTYIADKLMETFAAKIHKDSQVIKRYNRYYLVIYHFQKWILRLFNRFITNYNKFNTPKLPRFKNFVKLLKFIDVNQYNFTYNDLLNLVLKENSVELNKLLSKQQKNDKIKELDDLDYEEIKYNYWDRFQSFEGTDMMDDMDDNDSDVYMTDD
ncbi:hypothetical protein CLIB1444_08S00694 [[Candida] jaroonii]|uniref:Uncharacterized protein n=1 Tax=[Candida] jaroonii TaxID=467808 RepID=A0ACA9YC74_9ASCO|nr:hypothetical protein CLIB1444_08S00694 [[Candida] jaroonii]